MRVAWSVTMDVHRNYGECQRTEREQLVFIANESIEDLVEQMRNFLLSDGIVYVKVLSIIRIGEVY